MIIHCLDELDKSPLLDWIVVTCCVDVKPDGLIFDPSTVSGSVIREGAIHDGVRMKFTARLGSARNQLQVDVGFGDAVVPPPSRFSSIRILPEFSRTRRKQWLPRNSTR